MDPAARVIPGLSCVRSVGFGQMGHQQQHSTWISVGCSETDLRAALLVCRLVLQQAACSVSAQGTVSGAICPSLQPVTGTEALLQQPLAAEAAPQRPVLPDVFLLPEATGGAGGLGACGHCCVERWLLFPLSSQAWRKHSLELQERLPSACAPSTLREFCLALWLLFRRSFLV